MLSPKLVRRAPPSLPLFAEAARQLTAACPLGGVDSKDSLLRANQIQGFFLGGGLGCDGSVGVERRGLGTNGAADHRPARPEGLDRAGQPDVRGRCALDRAYRLSLA